MRLGDAAGGFQPFQTRKIFPFSCLSLSSFPSCVELMMNMVWLLFLFSVSALCLTANSQESVEFLALHDSTPETLEALSDDGLSIAVQVESEHLKNVSRSLLMAETWVRAHVMAYYPAINISTIVVGQNVLCNKNQEHKLVLVFPSIKNIHYSLTRWGLQNDIKVSASFSSNCLDSNSETYSVHFAQNYIKPLLNILQDIGSPYVVHPPPHLVDFSDETLSLVKSHLKSMKNLGDFQFNMISTIVSSPRKEKLSTRKLSFIDLSNMIDPFPSRPTPIAPSHASSGTSVPAYAARSPLPPLVGMVSPPPNALPFSPSLPPMVSPPIPPFLPHLAPMANPPSPQFGPHLPPCNPSGSIGAPVAGVHNGLWCVAKPNVPPETLQEALDYACGEGGADCESIKPQGTCYFPDTVVAHASYAFNSYWQKTKRNGGTCSFGGTAMLINSDPSYRHCGFILT